MLLAKSLTLFALCIANRPCLLELSQRLKETGTAESPSFYRWERQGLGRLSRLLSGTSRRSKTMNTSLPRPVALLPLPPLLWWPRACLSCQLLPKVSRFSSWVLAVAPAPARQLENVWVRGCHTRIGSPGKSHRDGTGQQPPA